MRRWATAMLASVAAACAMEPPPPIEDLVAPDAVTTDTRADARPRAPATTTPYPRADLTVTLPYRGPEQSAVVTLPAVSARVDVHLAVDTTASFGGEIAELRDALLASVVPQLRARVPSLTLGVSRFEDMPYGQFGTGADRPFRLMAQQTSNEGVVYAAVRRLDQPLGFGGDGPESWVEALYQIGTGEGLAGPGGAELVPRFVPQAVREGGSLGGVGFRERAARVVVLVTDAPPHEGRDYAGVVPNAHSSSQALEALARLNVRVVGIASGAAARASLEAVAQATGAVVPPTAGLCLTGLAGQGRRAVGASCPLVFDIDPEGEGLSQSVVETISRLLDAVAFGEVHGETEDDPSRFVEAIEAASAMPPDEAPAPQRADRRPEGALDGVLDTFTEVRARTVLGFRLRLRNTTVPEREWPQVAFVRVAFLGDGQVLREMVVRIIVPEGPKLDAGARDGRVTSDAGPPDADAAHAGADDADLLDASVD